MKIKRIISLCLAAVAAFSVVFCLAGCDGTESSEEESSEYSDTTEDAEKEITLCAYFTGEDGAALANTEIKVNNSGEELTYMTDYLGYAEIPNILIDNFIDIETQDGNGNSNAKERIKISYGEDYKFDSKEKSNERLTVPDGVQIISAQFSVTSDGKFNCTSLS